MWMDGWMEEGKKREREEGSMGGRGKGGERSEGEREGKEGGR